MSRIEALTFVSLAHFFDHFFLLIFPTAAIAIADEWEISYAAALALGTPIYVAFAVGTLPAGWLGDRFDRIKLLHILKGAMLGSIFNNALGQVRPNHR